MKHHSKITPPKPGQDARLDQSVLSRIAALKTMSVKELKTEWERLLGSAAPNNIVTDKLWDQVDAILQGNRHARSSNSRMQTPAPLKGLIFTDTGAAMTPTATKKRGKLYRYYVSMDVIKNRTTEDDSGGDQAPVRLPAGMVEDAIVTEVRRILQTPEVVTQVLAALKRDLKPLSQTYADQDAFLHDVPRLIRQIVGHRHRDRDVAPGPGARVPPLQPDVIAVGAVLVPEGKAIGKAVFRALRDFLSEVEKLVGRISSPDQLFLG